MKEAAALAGWKLRARGFACHNASLGLAVLFGCAAGAPVDESLPALEPAPSGRPTVPWTEGMPKPHLVSDSRSSAPAVTKEFREDAAFHNPGRVVSKIRCTLTVEGLLRACVVEQSVPTMDRQVLRWLGEQHYSPVTLDGKPVQASYVFTFRFCAAPVNGPAEQCAGP